MSHHRLALVVVAIATLAPHAALAQKDLASCKAVLDAAVKERTVPHRMYMTNAAAGNGDKGQEIESVVTATQTFVKVQGRWTHSRMTPADLAKMEDDNIRDAKALVCHRLREESVGGTAAVVYAEHTETGDTIKSDGQLWIASSSGLMLRAEIDLDTGDGMGKSHMSTRYEYTNVQPPAGVP